MAVLSNPWFMFVLCSLTLGAVFFTVVAVLSGIGLFRAGRRPTAPLAAAPDQRAQR